VTAPPDAPIEVQLDAFRRAIESIYSRMDHFERQSLSRDSALEASLDALTSEVRGISTLTRRLDDEASAAARTDARGLGPVAFGFVMVAAPDHLASVSLFGAFFTDAADCDCGDRAGCVSRSPGILGSLTAAITNSR
jgi:hypothetical protein